MERLAGISRKISNRYIKHIGLDNAIKITESDVIKKLNLDNLNNYDTFIIRPDEELKMENIHLYNELLYSNSIEIRVLNKCIDKYAII